MVMTRNINREQILSQIYEGNKKKSDPSLATRACLHPPCVQRWLCRFDRTRHVIQGNNVRYIVSQSHIRLVCHSPFCSSIDGWFCSSFAILFVDCRISRSRVHQKFISHFIRCDSHRYQVKLKFVQLFRLIFTNFHNYYWKVEFTHIRQA